MSTRVQTDRRSWPVPADAAQLMVSQAIAACMDNEREGTLDSLLEQLRRGDPATWSNCRMAVAQRVGEYLEACDDEVKAVYIYDNDWAPEDPLWSNGAEGPLIHLIVWAQPKTAALRALIAVLNRALSRQLGNIIQGRPLAQLLDVQFIDDEDLSSRAGYASLLNSSRYRPVQVWTRQTA